VDAELSPIRARRRPYHPNAAGVAAVAELVLAALTADHRGNFGLRLTLAYRRSSQAQQTIGTHRATPGTSNRPMPPRRSGSWCCRENDTASRAILAIWAVSALFTRRHAPILPERHLVSSSAGEVFHGPRGRAKGLERPKLNRVSFHGRKCRCLGLAGSGRSFRPDALADVRHRAQDDAASMISIERE
jgi:hypothetical protein